MRMMPNIKLTQEEVNRLLHWSKFDLGGESIICATDNPKTLYKIFTKHGKPIGMSDNKTNKVLRLHQMELEHSVQPVSTISMGDTLIGYEMTHDENDIRFKQYVLPRQELIHFLRQSKEILEYFEMQGIIYGDVAPRNILINRATGVAKFCDMDNIQLEEYPIDFMGGSLFGYSEERGIDSATDAYMHNIMTLQAFGLDCYFSSRQDVKKEFKPPIHDLMDSMRNPKTFTGEYAIQYIKEKKM